MESPLPQIVDPWGATAEAAAAEVAEIEHASPNAGLCFSPDRQKTTHQVAPGFGSAFLAG